MKVLDIYEMKSGVGTVKKTDFNLPDNDISIVMFTEIFHNFSLPQKLSTTVKFDKEKVDRFNVKRGDVFLTASSEKKGELAMSSVALKDYNNTIYNGFSKRLRPTSDNIHPEYMKYWFRSKKFRNQIDQFGDMTTRINLNISIMEKIEIELPLLNEQIKIADRISAYDDKIENNNKIINTLEEMASLLYKRYFVDFEFPNDEGKPYKSNGGQFTDSDLVHIPTGWEYSTYSFLDIRYGKSIPKNILQNNGYVVYGGNGKIGFIGNYMFENRKIIIGCRGNQSGNTYYTDYNSNVSSNSLVINCESMFELYLLFYSKSQTYADVITGSAQPQITITNLQNKSLLIPEESVLKVFNKKVKSMIELQYKLQIENNILLDMRDLLINELIK